MIEYHCQNCGQIKVSSIDWIFINSFRLCSLECQDAFTTKHPDLLMRQEEMKQFYVRLSLNIDIDLYKKLKHKAKLGNMEVKNFITKLLESNV